MVALDLTPSLKVLNLSRDNPTIPLLGRIKKDCTADRLSDAKKLLDRGGASM
jgi:hypothetical protein